VYPVGCFFTKCHHAFRMFQPSLQLHNSRSFPMTVFEHTLIRGQSHYLHRWVACSLIILSSLSSLG
jgi:hypothetical protein